MMDISPFNIENVPRLDELEKIGQHLMASLSTHVGMELLVFKEHYVEEGSIALTFRSAQPLQTALVIQMEGSLLFDLRAAGLPPAVEAELLLFSFGQRIGLQSHRGNSYARLSYEFATGNWISPAWLPDGPEEWEGVNQLRAADYPSAVKSCDLRGSEM